MKRFRFRLKRLQELRTLEEERAEAALRQARARVAGAEDVVHGLHNDVTEVFSGLTRALASGRVAPEEPARVTAHAARIELALAVAQRDLELARRLASEAAADLQKRRSERKALDELERRARETWHVDAVREENAFFDEVAVMRHAASQLR